jgi:hypothetical protein
VAPFVAGPAGVGVYFYSHDIGYEAGVNLAECGVIMNIPAAFVKIGG